MDDDFWAFDGEVDAVIQVKRYESTGSKVFPQFKAPRKRHDELAHHRADNEFRRLSGVGQAVFKALAPRSFVQNDHGWHIQGFAQEGTADLRQAGLDFDVAAWLVVARVEAGKSGGLPAVSETIGIGIKRQDNDSATFTDARNTVEKRPFLRDKDRR